MPPAFNLSQDQTLQFNLIANFLARKIKENNKYFLSCSASIWLSPSTHTYRLFCFLKSGAGRCVSFPSLRCLLRRRTIPPHPTLVNAFLLKNGNNSQDQFYTFDFKRLYCLTFLIILLTFRRKMAIANQAASIRLAICPANRELILHLCHLAWLSRRPTSRQRPVGRCLGLPC